MNLTNLLTFLDTLVKIAGPVIPGAAVPATLADGLLQLIIKAKAAHEAITGKPLDLANLPKIADIP